VALASRLAGATDRAVGEHHGIGSIRSRLADRPDALQTVELMAAELTMRR
jgi:hypothetical protein